MYCRVGTALFFDFYRVQENGSFTYNVRYIHKLTHTQLHNFIITCTYTRIFRVSAKIQHIHRMAFQKIVRPITKKKKKSYLSQNLKD